MLILAICLGVFVLLVLDSEGRRRGPKHLADVEIVAGQHAGKRGRVTSFPWIGNGYHTTLEVNVPSDVSGFQPRAWVRVHRREVQVCEP